MTDTNSLEGLRQEYTQLIDLQNMAARRLENDRYDALVLESNAAWDALIARARQEGAEEERRRIEALVKYVRDLYAVATGADSYARLEAAATQEKEDGE